MRIRPRPLVLVMLLGRFGGAQAPAAAPRPAGATVSGVVRDSIAHAPLAGAMVQLVSADTLARVGRTAIADSLGRFALDDVADGRYRLGFFHPLLDSIGVAPPLREVLVEGRRSLTADLATPSPARLRTAICGAHSTADSGAVVVGVVRDARDGAPASGVTVIGEWAELTLGKGGLVRRFPRLVATTGENGWFAMCNVPSAGTMALAASRGADSTDLIEVQLPPEGFLRRELYLGRARTVVVGDTMRRADSLAPPRRVHLGDERLSGTVVSAVEGRPLEGAQVGIYSGPQTRANERGEWTLADAPAGTRMLEVRAVGYYPVRHRVDVVAGAAPIRVALSTLKAVLDTVKVTAARLGWRDLSGFQDRRRSSIGRYLDAKDISRRNPVLASDLFRSMAGVSLERDGVDTRLTMRGTFTNRCVPSIFIDGHLVNPFEARGFESASDSAPAVNIDDWVRPKDIAALEVYAGGTVPAAFQGPMDGCGAVLIWTK